jgi:cation transport regulator ChaC
MSYAVVHMQKIKIGGIRGIENHNERLKESHTNPDIDYKKSHLNQDLHDPFGADERSYYNRVRDRIKELNLPKAVRKDAVVTCGFICTSDKEFFDKLSQMEKDRFFLESHTFLKKQYGEKNVIAANVHYDEHTPHMHCYIIPVTQDGRLSAKDVFNKVALQNLQNNYHRHLKENGFDLERGKSAEGKNKHLSEQEFKLQTKFEQLKSKEQAIERLEAISTHVPLEAEKGKFLYDTKEVDAIKEQNRALKLQIYETKQTVDTLTGDVSRLQNKLAEVQKALAVAEPQLERLKDLECETKELQEYVAKSPDLQKQLTLFEKQKNIAYEYGKAMVLYKNKYMTANTERRTSIEKTYALEKAIQTCDSHVNDLQHRKKQINASEGQIKTLEGQLEQTTGFFKGKERKALQEQLDREKTLLREQTDSLKTVHNVDPTQMDRTMQDIEKKKRDLSLKKRTQGEYTHLQEGIKDKAVKEYKFCKEISTLQEPGFQEISSRQDARVEIPDYRDNIPFLIGREDRVAVLERMEQQHPLHASQYRKFLDQQAQQEQSKDIENNSRQSKDRGAR